MGQALSHQYGAGGANGEDAQLQQAVAMAMDIACVEKMGSIALPLIGTGVFGNPTGMAAKVHVAQVLASLNTLGSRCPGVLQVSHAKHCQSEVALCNKPTMQCNNVCCIA